MRRVQASCFARRSVQVCSACALLRVVCAECIRIVLNGAYHERCFKCSKCSKLIPGAFIERSGKAVCNDCAKPGPRSVGVCYGCKNEITGESQTVRGKLFHIGCFKCENCANPFVSVEKFVLKEFPWAIGKSIMICENCYNGSLHADQPIEMLAVNQASLTTYYQFWNDFRQFQPLQKQMDRVAEYLLSQFDVVPQNEKAMLVELCSLLISAMPRIALPAFNSALEARNAIEFPSQAWSSGAARAAAEWFAKRLLGTYSSLSLKISSDWHAAPVRNVFDANLLTEENLHHDQKPLHMYNQNAPDLKQHDRQAQLTQQRPQTHQDWSAPAHWGEAPEKPEVTPTGWAPKPGIQNAPGIVRCPKCSSNIPPPGRFCVQCGHKVEGAAPVVQQIFCTGCGIPLQKTAKFCLQCGTENSKFEEKKQAPLVGAAPEPAWKRNLKAKPRNDKL